MAKTDEINNVVLAMGTQKKCTKNMSEWTKLATHGTTISFVKIPNFKFEVNLKINKYR